MENYILDRHKQEQNEDALFSLLCCMLDLSFQSLAGAGQDYAQLATNLTMLTPLRIVKLHCLPF